MGIVNSVNLTDGIDGLDGSVTFFACVAFMLIACVKSYHGITAMSAASAGACLGFLVWNFHPAKVFMGDTGSLFLGAHGCYAEIALYAGDKHKCNTRKECYHSFCRQG